MKQHEAKRSSFSGKIGFVLSAAGASVGLGNIWRFPYLAAKYGGGIFLVIYIILALTFGYTMIIAETALGRMTRKSPVGAYASFGKSKLAKAGGMDKCDYPNPHSPVLFGNRRLGHKISCRIRHRADTGSGGGRIFFGIYLCWCFDGDLLYHICLDCAGHYFCGCAQRN